MGGYLILYGCTGLTALPENLSVGGYLILYGCTGLTALPENLSVGGYLILYGCTGLTALPENLSVGGNLDLRGCTGLTALPENLSVGGNLDLRGCTGLTALPENLSVGGNLDLRGCTGLTALPENLSVGGDLSLDRCTGLTALPENLSVGGNLDLRGCTGLTALPENLSVGGDLSLRGCTGLTALPENLSVGGYLFLYGCTGLTALPENLSVGGDLSLYGCTGLTALPNWITTLGMTTEGNIRIVNLENTGLSDTLIDRLREVETTGMNFHFSRSAGQPEQKFSNVLEGLTFWRQLTSADSEIPELNLRHDQATDLVGYLGRLTNTADYQNQATRPVLAQRVMAVPAALLTGSDGIRDEAMDHIHHALTSCDDRIILALDDLETLQLLDSAEKKAFAGNAGELRELGLQMMRLDEVKRIARDHMKSLSWVDEIEVELAFQIGVRQQLALPGSTQHMIFRGCANVSGQDIANAVNQVNTHCSDDNLQAYLAQWSPWQKYLRRQDVPAYDQLTQKTVDRIENCVISAEITPNMVALGDHHLDYDALVKSFIDYGMNPLTNSPMDWSNVFRLTKEDSPPPPLNG
ncbi:NEL-type E3 ubiquitin ligase domain-containing protein [Endozoicomonas atrinae]|uniref:NEL-type E3 ubiquitin ligase domain-containing protein n=1 Tax=Endozoicomonas atrinae TaxID=1333660 RepID=UPI003B007CB6